MIGMIVIQDNILLKNFTTFKIGGPARYFVVAKTVEDVAEAVRFAHEKKLPMFVLGGGSNILVRDEGFSGVVIKIELEGIEEVDKENGVVEVVAGAGVNWDTLVEYAVSRGLYGIENLSLIPGTVGAAPVQNIGAYGAEIIDTLSWVEVLDTETCEVKRMTSAECQFDYRKSIFKKPEGKKYSITRAALLLSKNGTLNTSYKDVADYITKHAVTNVALEKMRDIIIAIRRAKLPDLGEYGTAGSFFKNPIISEAYYNDLVKTVPDIPRYPAHEGRAKISAAWMLDNLCGFRGFREGNIGVYKNQALVIVNFGHASQKEISALAEKMISCVKQKTGITLECEVEMI